MWKRPTSPDTAGLCVQGPIRLLHAGDAGGYSWLHTNHLPDQLMQNIPLIRAGRKRCPEITLHLDVHAAEPEPKEILMSINNVCFLKSNPSSALAFLFSTVLF